MSMVVFKAPVFKAVETRIFDPAETRVSSILQILREIEPKWKEEVTRHPSSIRWIRDKEGTLRKQAPSPSEKALSEKGRCSVKKKHQRPKTNTEVVTVDEACYKVLLAWKNYKTDLYQANYFEGDFLKKHEGLSREDVRCILRLVRSCYDKHSRRAREYFLCMPMPQRGEVFQSEGVEKRNSSRSGSGNVENQTTVAPPATTVLCLPPQHIPYQSPYALPQPPQAMQPPQSLSDLALAVMEHYQNSMEEVEPEDGNEEDPVKHEPTF